MQYMAEIRIVWLITPWSYKIGFNLIQKWVIMMRILITNFTSLIQGDQ